MSKDPYSCHTLENWDSVFEWKMHGHQGLVTGGNLLQSERLSLLRMMWVVPGRWLCLTLFLKSKLILKHLCCVVVQHLHEYVCTEEEHGIRRKFSPSAWEKKPFSIRTWNPLCATYIRLQDWLHCVWGQVPNVNRGPFAKKLFRILRQWQQSIQLSHPVQVPSTAPRVTWPWSWSCPLVPILPILQIQLPFSLSLNLFVQCHSFMKQWVVFP